jgi:GNAT superfamily N-acetyltransferase
MLTIRLATVDDVALLRDLICGLAEYEHARDKVVATAEDLARDGFGADPKFRALIAEWDGEAAGYALFFEHYSTWIGRPGIYLEDIFVWEKFRGKAIGKALLVELARIARRENYYGVRWEVLDWNRPAIDFYERLGAVFQDEWRSMVLRDEALRRVAGE